MKEPEYIEGPEALENFEDGMRTIFKAAKPIKRGKKKATPFSVFATRGRGEGAPL
jgi:hypothetical protein